MQCILASLWVTISLGGSLECRLLSPILGNSQPVGKLGRALGSSPLKKLPFDSDAQQVWDPLMQITFLNLKLAVRNILFLKILNKER